MEVIRLKRNAIGPVKLGMLPLGEYRELTNEEIFALKNYATKVKRKSEAKNSNNVKDKKIAKRSVKKYKKR